MKKVLLFLMALLPLFVSSQVKRTIHVTTAGTLPTLISEEEKYQIEELTLSGELNGTDFKFIRDMAGVIDKVCRENYGEVEYWAEHVPTKGVLKSLDLAESRVLNGGEVYGIEGGPTPTSLPPEGYQTVLDCISSYLFARTKLETIILPNSITSIGACVFYNCNHLTSIIIPKNVTEISNGAFNNSIGLTSIIVESGNQNYDSRNNCNAIVDNNNQLIAGCKNTIIPNSVTSIGTYAFSGCSGLASITIPNNVTSIGDGAFQGCSSMTSLTIGNSVTDISEDAFDGCTSLTSIKVADGNPKYDSRNNCNALIETSTNTLIKGCNNTVIPNGLTSIGNWAFSGCTGLTSVIIPNSVTSIGYSTFYGCSGLKSVTSQNPVPPSITSTSLGSVYEQAVLNVPHGSKKAYMNADFWKLFKTINEVGDINGDGKIDSADIKEIENYIMGNPSPYFDVKKADINNDGVVNIEDVVAIINIIKNNSDSDKSDNYLTFVAEETGTFKFGGIRGNEGISYSLDDGNTWYTLARNTDSPTVSAGNNIMWKGLLTPLSSYDEGIGEFSSTGRFTVEGNIMSLLYGDDFQNKTSLSGKDFAFAGLFSSCTGLTSAENLVLPATTLANDCYRYMFYGCTSLTAAPSVLPATKLSFYCYEAMFSGCTSLTTAPELPATTLAYSCYSTMFEGCTNLLVAPTLPAPILVDRCYYKMFCNARNLCVIRCLATDISASNCTYDWVASNSAVWGDFYKAPGMSSWTRGSSGIPGSWTIHEYTQ